MNIAVRVGIGVVTLGQMETRWKRARAIDYLHELRSIALPDTAHSPKQELFGPPLER